MQDSSLNHLPQCKLLHQGEAHLLWKLMTKGERLYKDMKTLGEIETKILQLEFWTWTMDKEGATLRNGERSKFLDKRSTQVGGASL